jgi:hypothetical protein
MLCLGFFGMQDERVCGIIFHTIEAIHVSSLLRFCAQLSAQKNSSISDETLKPYVYSPERSPARGPREIEGPGKVHFHNACIGGDYLHE